MINLKKYFEEKELGYKEWEFELEGILHFISNEAIIEAILEAPKAEQKKIGKMISKIDFKNGDINDYLKHLARGYIVTNF